MNEYETGVSIRFSVFCTKVLKLSSYKWFETVRRREKRELSLSLLHEDSHIFLCDPRDYSILPGYFVVYGTVIEVRHEALADAISHLDTTRREVILLYYFLDLKNKEIAKIYNCTTTTVSRWKSRAIKQMRKEMMEDG